SADVLKAHARSPQVPLFAALQIPSGMARSHSRSVAMLVRKSVLRARVNRSGATAVLYENENPMSPFSTEWAQYAYRTGSDWFIPCSKRRPLTVCAETRGFKRIASTKLPGAHCRRAKEKIEMAKRSNIACNSRRVRYLM